MLSSSRRTPLSDHACEALHEIQHQLLVEDPGFAQSFDIEVRLHAEPQQPHHGSPDLARRICTILLVLSLTYVVICWRDHQSAPRHLL